MAVYTIDFDEMLNELASRLEVGRNDNYFTEADMKRWINLGVIEMAKRTKVVHVVKYLYLSANVNRYTCPSDWLYGQNRQVLYLKSGALSGYQYPLKKLDARGMQAIMPSLTSNFLSAVSYNHPSTGPPQVYMLDGSTIEILPIPTSAVAGSNRICFKFPGIPDGMTDTSATVNIPLEHRMVPVLYAEHLGQKKDKDPRARDTLQQFYAECDEINADTKWGDQEEPPVMASEEYYLGSSWSIL